MTSIRSKQIRLRMVLENLNLETRFGYIYTKKGFPSQRKHKLRPRAEGPLEVLEKINDDAYKINLGDKHSVSATFNVGDLASYLEDEELRTTHFE